MQTLSLTRRSRLHSPPLWCTVCARCSDGFGLLLRQRRSVSVQHERAAPSQKRLPHQRRRAHRRICFTRTSPSDGVFLLVPSTMTRRTRSRCSFCTSTRFLLGRQSRSLSIRAAARRVVMLPSSPFVACHTHLGRPHFSVSGVPRTPRTASDGRVALISSSRLLFLASDDRSGRAGGGRPDRH